MSDSPKQELAALMFTDIVGSVALQNKLGTETYTKFVSRHDEIFKRCMKEAPSARILNETGDGFLVRFDTPTEAVNTALRLQAALHGEVCEGEKMELCIGLNLGAVTEMEEGVRGTKRAVGMAINLAARVMDLAEGNQILMTRAVFDDARQFVREHPQQAELPESAVLQWPAHGRYIFKGNDDPLEIYEVGAEGMAPLSPPEGGGKAKRAVAADEEDTLGWRPGAGLEIPRLQDWIIEEKLGQGGFGEVWLAKHISTKEERVFKFCFDPERLRSFRRELTLFRLLRDALGKRDDIAALYDVSIEMPPFYLESEYIPNGNLGQWVEKEGGLNKVPLDTRLDLVARSARAVDAAHSVGIVHKDIKPSNILISTKEGSPRPRLADFGIGAVTDTSALSEFGITQAGFTQSIVVDSDSGTSHSSMTQLYAPPEYLVGKAADPKGDIYSLGVMLFQLAVGDLHRPLASGWRRDVPDDLLQEIIDKCVDVDPKRRFDSAGHLAERLETLDERRTQLEETRRAEALQKQAKKRRRFLIAAVLTCLGLIGLVCYFAESYMSQKQLTAEAETARLQTRMMASQSDFLLAGHLIEQDRHADAVAHLARAVRLDPSNRVAGMKLFSTLANTRFQSPIYPPLQIERSATFEKSAIISFDAALTKALTLNEEEKLTIFDLATGQPIGEAFDHRKERVKSARLVNNDKHALGVTEAKNGKTRLRLWDAMDGRLIRQEPQGDSQVKHRSLSEDGSYVIVERFDSLALIDLTTENWNSFPLPPPDGEVKELFRTPNRDRLVSLTITSLGQKVSLLDIADRDPSSWHEMSWRTVAIAGPPVERGPKPEHKLSSDGTYLAIPEPGSVVTVVDLVSGAPYLSIDTNAFANLSLAFSPDSNFLVVGSFNSNESKAEVWDLKAKSPLPISPKHDSGVSMVAVSPDVRQLLTGDIDGKSRLWNLETGALITEHLVTHQGLIAHARFSADSQKCGTVSKQGTICVWDLAGGVVRPTPITQGKRSFWSLAPMPLGKANNFCKAVTRSGLILF